jgi:hypothetical protein
MPDIPVPMTAMRFLIADLPCIPPPSSGCAERGLRLFDAPARLRAAAELGSCIGLLDPNSAAGRIGGHASFGCNISAESAGADCVAARIGVGLAGSAHVW